MAVSESETLIRRLYNIITEANNGFEYQVNELLKLGCERFKLDIGILSNINGEEYTVMHCVCPQEVELKPGAKFILGSTYCSRTMLANKPVGYEYVKKSEMSSHPAYSAFGLEAYIGVPIIVNDEAYGTLNFSSPVPLERKFSEVDIDALSLMASWLGAEIERRQSEKLLIEANKKLLNYSKKLSDHTDELEISKELSDQASKEKSKFLATMSHEIRTPMNGVLGMAELLNASDLNVIQKDYVRTILDSGHLLLSIINDILDYSKLDAGKLQLENIEFNLEWLAYDVVEMMSRDLIKGVELVLDYEFDAPRNFYGDPMRIRQILFNIVGNAVKFTKEGHIRLLVKLSQEQQEKSGVVIVVEDTGIGISKQQRKNIFKPFNQADLSTTRQFGGTGLGLAICQQLISIMSGNITLESRLKQGTAFTIQVPLKEASRQLVTKNNPLEDIKILLIGNDVISRKVIQRLLLHLNTRVTIVSKPSLVLTELQKSSNENDAYDIVIIDDQKSEQTDKELAISICSNKYIKQPALIALTSFACPGDAEQYEQAGFSAYLNKPLRSDIFKSVLELVAANEKQDKIITKYHVVENNQENILEQKFTGTVLLVEDNVVNQMVATSMLEEIGVTVELAEDGLQAVEASGKRIYDLILMDCQMPNMDGYEATKKIRSEERTQHVPIVALTANANEEDINLCYKAGMDSVIIKPFMPVELIKVISRYLMIKSVQV